MITQSSIDEFLERLASAQPTPGGGSAAAIMGAMGAALVSMVCNVSIGKKGYEAVEAGLQAVRARSEALRRRLGAMVAEDVAAFDGLMAAYKLPKAAEEQKNQRAEAVQASLRRATEVPLDCARVCAEVIELARRAGELGYRGVISDAGVGALAAYAAARSAALNVYINAPALKDREFAHASLAELEKLLARLRGRKRGGLRDRAQQTGELIMPGGKIDPDRPFIRLGIAILTISDSRDQSNDTSGDLLAERVETAGHELRARALVRDDKAVIQAQARQWIADSGVDVIITTGGTGLTGRDVSPEAFRELFDKELEGFTVLWHLVSYETVGVSTMQSRACAGIAGNTVIYVLPGSNGACRDGWDKLISRQLDSRHRPCSIVEVMPRFQEH